jgi:hypothetical protein
MLKWFLYLLWLIFGHYVLDYPLQGDFLASTKGKYFYSLLAHSLIYSSGMSLIFYYINKNMHNYKICIVFLVVLISHIIIDYLKSHAKDKEKALKSYLYMDQCYHMLINFSLMIILG